MSPPGLTRTVLAMPPEETVTQQFSRSVVLLATPPSRISIQAPAFVWSATPPEET